MIMQILLLLFLIVIFFIALDFIKHILLRKLAKIILSIIIISIIFFYLISLIPKTDLQKMDNKLLITSATIMENVKEDIKEANFTKQTIWKFKYDFKKDSLDTRKLYK